MAKITKKQEFDELSKFGCAFLQTNNYGGYCIVIDDGGEQVLWRDCTSRNEHTARRLVREQRHEQDSRCTHSPQNRVYYRRLEK